MFFLLRIFLLSSLISSFPLERQPANGVASTPCVLLPHQCSPNAPDHVICGGMEDGHIHLCTQQIFFYSCIILVPKFLFYFAIRPSTWDDGGEEGAIVVPSPSVVVNPFLTLSQPWFILINIINIRISLQDDLLSKCLVQLTLEDLRNAELSCRRFYDTVYTSEIWRQKCESALPDMADVLSEVDTSDLDGPFGNDDESDAPKRDCIEDEVGNGCAAISFYRLSNSRGHRVKIQKKRAALKKLCYMLSKNECEESLIFRPVSKILSALLCAHVARCLNTGEL